MQKGLRKHISLASVLAFAVASGAAIANEQKADKGQQAQAGETNAVTSTDEMQRLAQQGKSVPEGQLEAGEVKDYSGDDEAETAQGDDAQASEETETAAAQDAQIQSSPLPQPEPQNDIPRHATAPMTPEQRAGEQSAGPSEAQGGGSAQGSAQTEGEASAQTDATAGQQAAGAGAAQGGQSLNPVNQAMVNPTLQNATPESLMGREVVDTQGQTIGKISDVVENQQTQDIRILVQPDQAQDQQGEQQVMALKMDQLKIEQGKIQLTKQMSEDELKQASIDRSQFSPVESNRTLGFGFQVPPSTAGEQQQQQLGELDVEYGEDEASAQEQPSAEAEQRAAEETDEGDQGRG
jgi:sporulation protein YlmC with PRC-barrel domain